MSNDRRSGTKLISTKRSIVIACDLASITEFERLVNETTGLPGVGGYKIGLLLTLKHGLERVVSVARSRSDLPLIYDHQKGGTDIPEMGPAFAKACRAAGVDAVILFPLSGPKTEYEWVRACQGEGLKVLVGGHMTHHQFLSSEGGYLVDDAPIRILDIAVELGVTDFVIPGNKLSSVLAYKKLLDAKSAAYVFYAPGFITQGGEISECGQVAGENWHAIVGSAIYRAPNRRKATERLAREIV